MTKMENPIVLSDWLTIGQLDLRKVNGKVNQPCAFGGRLIIIFLFSPDCNMELTEAMAVITERLPVGWSFRIMDDLTFGGAEGRIWRWVILDAQGIPKVFRPNSVSPEKFENVEGAILNLASFLTSNRVC